MRGNPRTKRLGRWFALCLSAGVAAVCLAAPRAARAAQGDVLWERSYGLRNPLEPLAGDFDYDGHNEVLLSDTSGRAVLVDSADGRVLWQQELNMDFALAPLPGHFLDPSGPLQIAWLDRTGEVCILNAPTGQTVCRARLSPGEGRDTVRFVLKPTLLPASSRGGADAIVAVSEDKHIYKIVAVDAMVVVNEWAESPLARLPEMALHTPAVGRWPDRPEGEGVHALAFLTVGRRLLVARPWLSEREVEGEAVWSIRDRQTCLSLREGTDGRVREILVPDDSGKIVRFAPAGPRAKGNQLRELPVWSAGGTQRSLQPILLTDINGDGQDDAVMTGEQDVWVLDGETGRQMANLGRYTTVRKFTTPAALFHAPSKPPYLVIGDDGRHIQIVNLLKMSSAQAVVRLEAGQLLATCPLVLDACDNGKAAIFVLNTSGARMIATEFGLPMGQVAWPQWAGSALHSGGRPRLYVAERQAALRERKTAAQRASAAAFEQLEAGNHEKALQLADKALRFNPGHNDAREARSQALSAKYRLPRRLVSLAVLLVALVAAALAWREWSIRKTMRRARELAGRGEAQAVVRAFRGHLRFHHAGFRMVKCMAELFDELDILDDPYTPLFEKWHLRRPKQQHIAAILARRYLKENRTDESAAGVYELARRFSDDQAPFELALGKVYAAHGHYKEARTHLEQAYRLGVREPDLFDALALVYAELDEITPKRLPVFERAARNHPKDARILTWLVQAYINASLQKDPRARKAVQALIALDPESQLANQELAGQLYRDGQFKEAQEAARKALGKNSENPVALQVLAWCLWQERDMSPEARQIYDLARRHHPNDSLLLRIAGQMALDDDTFDEQTASDFLKAIETNPNDTEFLQGAARAGQRWGHAPITARALENLSHLHELDEAQTESLAWAYMELGERAPEICPVLDDAFALRQSPEIADRLGEILARENLVDTRYGNTLAFLVDKYPARIDYAVLLAKVYRQQDDFEAMAHLLSQEPVADPLALEAQPPALRAEVQRLLAEAHTNLQEFAKAVAHYRSLLETRPDDPEALVGLARAYARMNERSEDMVDTIRQAHAKRPDDPWVNYALGETAAMQGRWQEASKHFQAALKAGAEFEPLVVNRINAFIRAQQGAHSLAPRWLRIEALRALGRYDEILEDTDTIYALDRRELERISALFEDILHYDAKNVPALIGRGRVLHRQGQSTESRLVLEMALNLDPDSEAAKRLLMEVYETILSEREDSGVRFALGELAMELHDYDRAVPCFQKTRLDPRLEKISTRRLAETFFRKEMYDLALQEYHNVPVDDETMPILYQIGRQFEGQNNANAARMAYQRIYATDASFQDVAERINNLTQSSEVQMTVGIAPIAQPAQEEIGDDRYELQEEIGRGAMASVYKAHDRELDEIVALKILPDSLLRNPEAVRRFRLEARSARRLTHENIVRIHDIGEEHGRKYISMEFIDGKTLKDVIRGGEGPPALPQVVNYALQICRAMAYAHGMGIVHRDIKPANIMITADNRVKITDFGIAKMAEASSQTMTGAVVGTPLYMSPEQIMGQPADARADIYSLGIVLYEMAAGTPPFHDGDLAYMHLHQAPEPLPDEVHPILEEIIDKCLRKDREDRWQDVRQIEERLEALEAECGDADDTVVI